MKSIVSQLCRMALASGFLLLAGGQAGAHFRRPEAIPLNRLLHSADRFLRRHPDDPNAHYTLARIHYLGFHLGSEMLPAWPYDDKADAEPLIADRWQSANVPGTTAVTRNEKVSLQHAKIAMDEFHVTLRLDPNNALAQLGIASLEEEFLAWGKRLRLKELPSELVGITPAEVRSAYAKSMQLAMPEDARLQSRPPAPLSSIVSYEAASEVVRLAASANEPLTDQERDEVRQAEAALAHFNSLPSGVVTPVVFSFQPVDHLDQLLAPRTVVDFDLRGFGPQQQYSWIRPELGILVWDPTHTGQIRSALQLFGGYTFQIFRDTRYSEITVTTRWPRSTMMETVSCPATS